MKAELRYSLRDFKKDFPNDEACLEYLFDTTHSRECSCGGTYARLAKRKQFQCSKCRFQIAPMSQTIFEKSSTPLTLWFHAIFIFSNAKSGISAKEMERQLGVTYKTAWRILTLIRKSLSQPSNKLKGDVEMDEAYMGGRGHGGAYNVNQSQVMKEKSVVYGAVEREGNVKAVIMPDASASSAWQFAREHIEKENTRLLTDSSNRYKSAAAGMKREMVDHGRKEFVRGDIHVNHIESFWSHVKRSVKGTHKVISKKYLQTYLDGFVFHYNNRHSDKARFSALLGALVG